MFSKKKKTKENDKRTRSRPNNSFGLPGLEDFGIQANPSDDLELEAELFALTGEASFEESITEGDGDEDDLEAELYAIVGKAKPIGKTFKKQESFQQAPVPIKDLLSKFDKSMSIEEDEDIDEDDPDLMDELMELTVEEEGDDGNTTNRNQNKRGEITIVEVLTERLQMYKDAESNAKKNKESARARRFLRGIKTIESLLSDAKAGKPIPQGEIPPVIATKLKSESEANVRPDTVSVNVNEINDHENQEIKNVLDIDHKKSLEEDSLLVKQPRVDRPLPNVTDETVKPVPLSPEQIKAPQPQPANPLPPRLTKLEEPSKPSPTKLEESSEPIPHKPNNPKESSVHIQPKPNTPDKPTKSTAQENKEDPLAQKRDNLKLLALKCKKEGNLPLALQYLKEAKLIEKQIEAAKISPPPGRPASSGLKFEMVPSKAILDALEQRLQKYVAMQKSALESKDETRVKRYQRIVKQYNEAISLHKAGKKIAHDSLPNPPGFAPLKF